MLLRKLNSLLILLSFTALLNMPLAQPKYKISFKGGYNVPLADLKGNI
jgi:hypothetical protein